MTKRQLSYILLGDGDFTYSLDMCRYLAALSADSSPSSSSSSTSDGVNKITHHDVTCTGVDTSEEVKSKYKDADFILTNIQSININKQSSGNTEQHTTSRMIKTKLVHGVNAVQPTCDDEDRSSLQHFDHVLFHHPHLGIEDAQLHKRFLLHFFHAANGRWMKPNGGLLYLTLVRGQCERWDCITGAQRHGLVLLRRSTFCPPPPPPPLSKEEKTYYQLRRHQSGKSFANRRSMQGSELLTTTSSCGVDNNDGESETLVFGRRCDYPLTSSLDDDVGMLPWENSKTITTSSTTAEGEEAKSTPSSSADMSYPCNYCTKSFFEQRSLNNHILCSHPDCNEAIEWAAKKKKKKKGKKRKLKESDSIAEEKPQQRQNNSNGGERLICKICESHKKEDEPTRVFPHKQALLDHERAKHSGVHLDIKPDWYNGEEETCDGGDDINGDVALQSVSCSCPICDLAFTSEADRSRHEQDFVPMASTMDTCDEKGASQTSSFQCSYCNKSFREERAKRQHENFCSSAATVLPQFLIE